MVNALLLASLLIVGLGLSLQVRNGLHRRPCSFLWGAAFLFLFVTMPLLSNLFYGPVLGVGWNQTHVTDPNVYRVYGVLTIAFSVTYLLTSLPWTLARQDDGDPDASSEEARCLRLESRLRTGIGLLVFLGVLLFLVGTGVSLSALLRGGRFSYFDTGAAHGTLVLLGQYLVGLIAVYAFFDARRGFPNRRFSGLVYAAMLFMMVVAGGRKSLIFAASGWLAGSYDRTGSFRINLRTVVGLATLVVILIGWQVARAVGWLDPEFIASFRDLALRRLPTLLWEGDAGYFYRASMESIRLNMREGLLYPLAILRRVVFLPFPAEFTFGLKPGGIPDMFARDLSFYSETRMGNLPPGLYGLYVLSFGWKAALVLGPILTSGAVRAADLLATRHRSWVRDVVFACFAMVMVLIMRGSEGSLYFLAFNLLVVGGLRTVLVMFDSRRIPTSPEPGGRRRSPVGDLGQ